MNQVVRDKFSELVLSFLLTLQGAFKSWTIWVNGIALALPYLADNVTLLQPLLPADYYLKLAVWLPIINGVLRFKTTMSLAAKAAKPTSVGDSLRSVIPVLLMGLLGLALLMPSTAHAQTEDPVRRAKDGRIYRSAAQLAVFKIYNPCPVTGLSSGACLDHVVDHVWPLRCARSELERKLFDVPANMQWQTVAASRLKDKTEGAVCRVSAAAAAADVEVAP